LLTSRNQEALAKAHSSGIFGAASEFVTNPAKGRLSSLRMFQNADSGNRLVTYVPLHDDILSASRQGKSFQQVAKDVNLHLYPETVRKRFQQLYEGGLVFDVRKQVQNNAAHFLPDFAQLMTQFPYEKGGGIELFRKSPLLKQTGVFQSWALFQADYLGNLVADMVKGGNKIKDMSRLAEMLALFYMLDVGFSQGLGLDYEMNPFASIPSGIPGTQAPVVQTVATGLTAVALKVKQLQEEIITGRENQFAQWEITRAKNKFLGSMASFVPGVVPGREIGRITGLTEKQGSEKGAFSPIGEGAEFTPF